MSELKTYSFQKCCELRKFTLALNLKILRKHMGLTQSELSKKLSFPLTTYSNYEKGINEPRLELLVRFSEFYNVSVDSLLGV